MQGPTAIRIGDVVQMRKPHACGANRWTITRTGADVRLRCDNCGRAVLMPRTQFLRALRTLVHRPDSGPGESPPAAPAA